MSSNLDISKNESHSSHTGALGDGGNILKRIADLESMLKEVKKSQKLQTANTSISQINQELGQQMHDQIASLRRDFESYKNYNGK